MKRFGSFAVAAVAAPLLLLGAAARADAQDMQRERLFKAPVFVIQPGLVTTNFIDTPSGTKSNTEFNFRFLTAVPTSIPRTTLVAIVQFTPFNKVPGTGGQFTANSPALVYGPVFNLFNNDLIAFDFDVLGAYGPAGRPNDRAAYTHKLVLEADLSLKLGQMMMSDPASRFRSLNVYAFLANVATGIPSEASPWVLLTGISLPIAP